MLLVNARELQQHQEPNQIPTDKLPSSKFSWTDKSSRRRKRW